MNKFNAFAQTEKGRYVVIGVLTVICSILFYFIFFNGESKTADGEKSGADTNVSVKDTAFHQRGDVYTTYDKEIKKVDADADFYKAGTEELKEALNEPAADAGSNDERQQRMADSILKANQSKVNYGRPVSNRKSNYTANSVSSYNASGGSAYEPVQKMDKEAQRQEEIEKFQRKTKNSFDAFFQGANAKKNSGSASNFVSSGSSNSYQQDNKSQNSDALIYAVINGDQLIKNKDRVIMKLSRDALINGEVYKKNTAIYGTAKFDQNRINLEISNINQKQVSLIVQDAMDGNNGIYIEGESFAAETANEAASDGINNINVSGIPVGKTIQKIISRKQKEPKVQLLNNYRIILKIQ